MLKAAATATRAPRGTKPVSQAFFTALESIPEMSRAAVAKAALTMIRDEMKAKTAAAKPTSAKRGPKAAAAPAPVVNGAAASKRRGRKPEVEVASDDEE